MIIAKFYKNKDNILLGFEISGHAGFADSGDDVVCASVSSAVMLTCNTATEAFDIDAKVDVTENRIMFKIISDKMNVGDKLVLGLMTHLYFLSGEYPDNVIVKEVLK